MSGFLIQLVKEIVENYAEGNQAAQVDYYLKNYQNRKHLGFLRQYLSSRLQYIVSFKIRYHGGYSKKLYTSWNKYVSSSALRLEKKLSKYWKKAQQVNSWLFLFQNIELSEWEFLNILTEPISLNQLLLYQTTKTNHSMAIIINICIKGIISILELNRFLYKK